MHLYNLTLQGQTAINQAVHGNFSGTPKAQEICVGRGSTLQLLFCDPTTGKIKVLCSHEVFGIIRSLMPFRLTGGTKDYISVGSDSGRIVILEYSSEKNAFVRVHQETFGKTGCRRIVPGHYLAVDPKGRAIMIGAVERQKLVYIMNRDAEARLTISSPLEAHKQYTLCYGMVGIDVGFENPTFACLEFDYENDLDDPDRSLMIICAATHKTKLMYFFLLQTEQGDLFKVTLETDEDLVTEMKVKYFDTVPAANAMCILKTGFLFVASEFGDHHLYQIANLGDDPEEPEFSSKMHLDEGETFFYGIRELKSLVPIDRIESLCPLTDAYIGDLAREDAPQIYALVGRGARSTLRVLRNGLEVSEMAVSELPGNPNAVWTVKKNIDDKHDAYIVVSFVNATLVLAIGETVEEANDSGFMATTPTLGCGIIGDDALLQIYPEGIRHIRSDRRVNEWKTPGKRQIVKCAMNRRQVAVALAGGELVYFELDPTGQLNEFTERTSWPHEVLCMSLSEIPEGELRSRFLTVGIADSTVRVISLDPQDTLSPLSMQALPSQPESLLLLETTSEDGKGSSTIHLNIGLQNGCLLRTTVDNVTGDMMDTRTRYLGTRPVRVFRVRSQNKDAVLCTSSRSWLLYHYQNRFHLTPLSYVTLESASSFSSEQCLEGIVAIAENTLRIMAVEKLGASFNHITYPLKFTPRRMIVHPLATSLMMIETDHAAYTTITLDKKRNDMADDIVRLATDMEEVELAKEIADVLRNNRPDETVYGAAKAAPGKWASVVRLLNVKSGEVLSLFELPQDEAAKCIALVQFASHQDTLMALVGCTISQKLNQVAKSTRGCIYTFLLTAAGDRFELIHRTETPYPVNAIHDFRGSALVGMSNHLRLYEFGKKKLLAKCENKCGLYELYAILVEVMTFMYTFRTTIAEPEQHRPYDVVRLQLQTVQQRESQPTEDEAARDDRDRLRRFDLQGKAFLVGTAGLFGLSSLHQLAQWVIAEFGSKG
ncbi:CPSF A subunit region [Ancylostoma ceylanicum]|uniref:CPSF A subunit region n=1 Tax=Ancylostoma ceylanicum TaxID=53326 RepID=A0A0D6LVR3_9BILA|nr:CPSF A subunit region [Ancylostoma ceylanicum]